MSSRGPRIGSNIQNRRLGVRLSVGTGRQRPRKDALGGSQEPDLIGDLAEREGFEPSKQVTPLGGLANRCTRPLCDLSVGRNEADPTMAPRAGWEAPVAVVSVAHQATVG